MRKTRQPQVDKRPAMTFSDPVNPPIPLSCRLLRDAYFTAGTTRTTGLHPREAFDRANASTYIPLGLSGAFSRDFGPKVDRNVGRFSPLGSVRTRSGESNPPAVHAA